MNLLMVEMRRAMRRRVVRVLIVLALVASAFAGVIAFLDSRGKTLTELQAKGGDLHPSVITHWWLAGPADGAVLIASMFLLLGGVFAGAAVAGAEWRAGTITTVLTWETRRTRLHLTRTAACGILAFGISLVLQVVFLASFVPATVANGSTAGTDADWWTSLALVIARTSLLTSVGAMLAVGLATLGRNTAFALATLFAWMAVIEGLVRQLRPGWAQYLWGENIGTVVPWAQLKDVEFSRGPWLALATLVLYTSVIVAAATITFQRRDIAGAS